jgi:hypothetical protein
MDKTAITGRSGRDAVQEADLAGWAGGVDFSALLVAVCAVAETGMAQATLICSLGSTLALHLENPA